MADARNDIKKLLRAALTKSDGTKTAFAKKYGIADYEDFYKFFKDMKENFKKDRESIALSDIVELAKSVSGRFAPGLGEFGAFVYVLRTVGIILDDLKRLSSVINELKEEATQESLIIQEAETLLQEQGVFDKVKNTVGTISQKLKVPQLWNSVRQYFRRMIGKSETAIVKVDKATENLQATTAKQKQALGFIESLKARAKDILETAKGNKKKIALGVLLMAVVAAIVKHVWNRDPLEETVPEGE